MQPTEGKETFFLAASRIHRLQIEALGGMEVPLTLRQYRILQRVQQGYTSPSDLSKLAHRALPTTSESIDALVRRGLLTRTPSAADRRAVILALTPSGKKAFKTGREHLEKLSDLVYSGLTATDRSQLEKIMSKIYSRSEEWIGNDG